MRRSRSFRSNPSRMAGRIKRYEKKLVDLFEEARPELMALVDGSGQRKMESLDLDSTVLKGKLEAILETRITEPGSGLVTDEAASSYRSGVSRADQLMRVKASLSMPTDKRVINALKLRSLTGLQGLTDEMGKQIMQVITDGVLRGDGPRDIARAISERVDVSTSRARTIARTESMKGFNTGATDRYKQYGIEKVEWSAALGSERTCSPCQDLNGNQYPIDAHPDCPLHPSCRCVLVPVIPKLEDL